MTVLFARRALVAAQGLTLVSTWPLWELRSDVVGSGPPLVPLVPLALPCGALLLASLVPILWWPRVGAALHGAMLTIAIALDVTRFSPAPVSLACLLIATSAPSLEPLARAQLGAMWLWAGLHKLLSPTYFAVVFPLMASSISVPESLLQPLAWVVACAEVMLGIAALAPRWHRVAAYAAPTFHLAALGALIVLDQNRGVWVWNLALAVVGYALFRDAPQAPRRAAKFAAAALVLSPALFYAGLIHPTLAHPLYSGATPTTMTCHAHRCAADVEARRGLRAFGVPVPPSVTAMRAGFLATCAPGDRWLARSRVRGPSYGTVLAEVTCP